MEFDEEDFNRDEDSNMTRSNLCEKVDNKPKLLWKDDNEENGKRNDNKILELLIDILDGKIEIDYYSRLKLDYLTQSRTMFANFIIQSGYLSQESQTDRFNITN